MAFHKTSRQDPGLRRVQARRQVAARFAAKAWPLGLFLFAFAVVALVFRPVWPLSLVLGGPDGMPDLSLPGFSRRVVNWALHGEAALSHDGLLKMLLPALVWHEWGLCLTFALQAVAAAAFFREMQLPRAACCCGGLAFAFSGYNFTLFAAGHRGLFTMTPYALFLFALVERAIRRPEWKAGVLVALAFVAGAAAQPDVMLLYSMLLAAYVAFRLASAPLFAAEGARAWWRHRRGAFGRSALVFAVAIAAIGAIPLRTLVGTALAGRTRQLASATAQESSKGADAEARAKWIFATNWSLPPAETLEFAAPGLHGLDSGNPRGPYWGALGRTDGWSADSPGGFFNYRQHSLYLGAVPCGMALFAVVAALVGGGLPRGRRASALFFACAAVLAWALAMGRFAPLYHLLYALPVFDKIRAPVKFVHVVELCVAALAAHGVAAIVENRLESRRARLAAAVVVCTVGAALLVGRACCEGTVPSGALAAIGVPQGSPLAAALGAMRRAAFARGGILLTLTAAVGAASTAAFARRAAWVPRVLAAALAAALVADQAGDASRYVSPVDVSARLAPCPPAAAVAARHAPPDGRSWSYLELTRQPLAEPQLSPFLAMDTQGFPRADPTLTDSPEDDRLASWRRLAFHPARFWALWGVSSVFMPRETARAFVSNGQGAVTGLYDIDRRTGRVVVPQNLRSAAIAMLEPAGIPPFAAVYRDWVETDDADGAAFAAFADPSFDPLRTATVSGPLPEWLKPAPPGSAPPAAAAKCTASPLSTPRSNRVCVETDCDAPALLVVRDYTLRSFLPRIRVLVDGAEVPALLRSAGGFPVVPLQPGHHGVELGPSGVARSLFPPLAGAALFIVLLVLWIRDGAGGAKA